MSVEVRRNLSHSATYTNGRVQDPTLTYDAAGSVIHKGDGVDPHTFQDTTYDAAGRRTALFDKIKAKFGGVLNTIQETKVGYAFDGDGNPVIEKRGFRTYHISDTNVPAMTENVESYQVWSSVLGSSLTKVKPDGTKWETRVFAGGALIAKQDIENKVEWMTSDTVTGTTVTMKDDNQTIFSTTEEFEAMGQKVTPHDPQEAPDPTYLTRLGSAGDSQWQCKMSEEYYGSFGNMPDRCGDAIYMPKGDEKPANPREIQPSTAPPAPGSPSNEPDGLSAHLTKYTLGATEKGKVEAMSDDNDEPIRIETRIPRTDSENEWRVEVNDTYLQKTLDSNNAENGGYDNCPKGQICPTYYRPTGQEIYDRLETHLRNDSCGQFLDSVRRSLGIRKNFLELLSDALKKGPKGKKGILFDPTMKNVESSSRGDEDQLALKPQVIEEKAPPEELSKRLDSYVYLVIHALIHRAGTEGHAKFAKAAFESLNKAEKASSANQLPLKKDEKSTVSFDDRNSDYFQRILLQKCPFIGESK